MKLDLRDLQTPDRVFARVIVTVNERIVKRVIAFDTEAGWVELLAGDGDNVIVLAHLDADAIERLRLGNFKGLGTFRLLGTVRVYTEIRDQVELVRLFNVPPGLGLDPFTLRCTRSHGEPACPDSECYLRPGSLATTAFRWASGG